MRIITDNFLFRQSQTEATTLWRSFISVTSSKILTTVGQPITEKKTENEIRY